MALSEYDAIESGRQVLERSGRHLSPRAQLLGGGIIILTGAFAYSHMEGIANRIGTVCLFHRITGVPCLLCGMTRSMAAMAGGRLVDAFRFHFLGPPLFLAIAAGVIILSTEYILGHPILPRRSRRERVLIAWGALGLLVVAWIAKLAVFGVNV
ncbi:MAG: hypothetical protein A2W01_09610 [Candidatus Solincola sediminis]|uniref:DUF2752 domain-containing protein n=1 Tax=Candidatus Solincola sediminis TaxID=1797199 RepID=A0A1F2WGV0_9ACTN|nr:MAG: hypothetical protein A2Y75_03010 [Candidatus Solincola sediminis]OFW60484.1 MAG: hypothetical protein A2W01_09610 [Candidatus Solincola sediminis]